MRSSDEDKKWQTTNVSNLLRNGQSSIYYARVKVNGKQKWRTLKTKVFSVAKLRLGDVEKEIRARASSSGTLATTARADDLCVGCFIAEYLDATSNDNSIAPSSKERRETAIKALIKTWPGLESRDVRRVSRSECQQWAKRALGEGTGFTAPNAKTARRGMSASALNKCIDALRAVFDIARRQGAIYENPAADVTKAPKKEKRLALPSAQQFGAVVDLMKKSGSRWSKDAADLAELLAYSGARLSEARKLTWGHISSNSNGQQQLTLPGKKTKGSYRTIPIFPRLQALLDGMRAERTNEPSHSRISRVGSCLDTLKGACGRLGVATMTHHDLRHLFATQCIEKGVDFHTIADWLGHNDGGVLVMNTYGHLRQEHSHAQAAKLTFGESK